MTECNQYIAEREQMELAYRAEQDDITEEGYPDDGDEDDSEDDELTECNHLRRAVRLRRDQQSPRGPLWARLPRLRERDRRRRPRRLALLGRGVLKMRYLLASMVIGGGLCALAAWSGDAMLSWLLGFIAAVIASELATYRRNRQ